MAVGFGGMSVGGIVTNRKTFGAMLPGVDHLPHTLDIARNAFSRGLPEHGAELADDLERLVGLHGADTIAAVIVEPMAGSTGVLLPPKGYLERLRAICDRHGILLIFDEVITGFGRARQRRSPRNFFGVTPDLITVAKGITNGAVPMGAVFAKRGDPRRAHARAGRSHRVLPRLHLFGPSRGLRGGAGDARHLRARGPVRTRRRRSRRCWRRPRIR